MVVTEATKEVIWLQGLLEDLRVVQKHVNVYHDNQSAIHLTKNQVFHARTKHIDAMYHFVREIIKDENILLQKIGTVENPVDIMTKVVSSTKFKHCLDLVNVLKF